MSDFTSPSYGDTIEASWGQAIVDHAFEKPAAYIIRKNGSNYEAIYGRGSINAGKLISGSIDTDASVTVQKAIDDMPSSGGRIHFTSEEFVFNKQFTSPVDCCIKVIDKPLFMSGEGFSSVSDTAFGSRLKLADSQNCTLLYYSHSASGNINLHNLGFNGNRTGQGAYNTLVYLTAGLRIRDSYICNCVFRNVAGRPLQWNNAMDSWMVNNTIEDAASPVYISTVYQFWFLHNYLFNLATVGSDYGLELVNGYLNHIEGNNLFVCYRHAMRINNMWRSNIADNIFQDNSYMTTNTYDGMIIDGTSDHLNVHDNTFLVGSYNKQNKYDIHVKASADYIYIKQNICKAYGTNHIEVDAGENPNGVVANNEV